MWDGSEWIPGPPSDALESKQSILMQDSVISGDVVHHTVHNDSAAISAAVVAALDRIGLVKGAPPSAMTEEQHHQLEEVNEMVDSAEEEGLHLSPDALWELAHAAILELDFDLLEKRLEAMAESAEVIGDTLNMRKAKMFSTFFANQLDSESGVHLPTFESYVQETLKLAIQHGSRSLEAESLSCLSSLASDRGDHRQSERIEKQELAIWLELEDWDEIACVYMGLVATYTGLGQYDEAEAYFEASLQLIRDHEMDAAYELMLYHAKVELLKKSRKGWFGRISKQGKAEIIDYVNLMIDIANEKEFDVDMETIVASVPFPLDYNP